MAESAEGARWAAVDRFLEAELSLADEALERAITSSAAGGLPPIAVSASQGKLLGLLVTLSGARRVLEIGTLGGYSAIWLARALPEGGRLVTLELDAHHAEVARGNLDAAGLAEVVEVHVGPALESLAALDEAGVEPFDLVFVDADKERNAAYLDWAIKLGRPGTVVVVDNVVRGGAVADHAITSPAVLGTRALFEALGAAERAGRLRATAIQTVGEKGYDGFALAVLTGDRG